MPLFSDEYFMNEALKEARLAFDAGEIPVGVVVVCQDVVIARGHNLTERLNDVTAHAEMMAITAAANNLGGKYLTECSIYITLEPCVMCAGALNWAQVARVVYGASDEKKGFLKYSSQLLHPKTELIGGVLQKECAELMIDFFRSRR